MHEAWYIAYSYISQQNILQAMTIFMKMIQNVDSSW